MKVSQFLCCIILITCKVLLCPTFVKTTCDHVFRLVCDNVDSVRDVPPEGWYLFRNVRNYRLEEDKDHEYYWPQEMSENSSREGHTQEKDVLDVVSLEEWQQSVLHDEDHTGRYRYAEDAEQEAIFYMGLTDPDWPVNDVMNNEQTTLWSLFHNQHRTWQDDKNLELLYSGLAYSHENNNLMPLWSLFLKTPRTEKDSAKIKKLLKHPNLKIDRFDNVHQMSLLSYLVLNYLEESKNSRKLDLRLGSQQPEDRSCWQEVQDIKLLVQHGASPYKINPAILDALYEHECNQEVLRIFNAYEPSQSDIDL